MLYYDLIDLCEAINLAKGNNRKEYMVCQYCFFNHRFIIKTLFVMVVLIC